MSAPKGNQYWRLRERTGRPLTFPTPDSLWEACTGYFEWVEANPLWESKPFAYQGEITVATIPKMRAMTLDGLYLFLDISPQAWSEYRDRDGYGEVTTRVERIIREQKFTGAAAELLNPNIIARDLGLRDKQDIEHSGELKTSLPDDQLDTAIAAAIARATGPASGR